MDAPRKVSIDAFIFSPRSQTSNQIYRLPPLPPTSPIYWFNEFKDLEHWELAGAGQDANGNCGGAVAPIERL